ncbi:cellulase family glycosylhydrolase [Emticicia sp. SJ17W-69]|uniref:cellulase family glycosylhydrolase n=1 Tax=Emticicia sp. SJ17W-69 TaxID=3421657 RepID=UPI003EBA407F
MKPKNIGVIIVYIIALLGLVIALLLWGRVHQWFVGEWVKKAKENFYVKGQDLFSPTHEKVVLRGVNLAFNPSDKAKALNMIRSIDSTKANCIRLVLNTDFISTNPSFFDDLITETAKFKMIPIVELHDKTCQALTKANIDFLVNFWLNNPTLLNILTKHKKYLILNIGNEVGDFEDKPNTVIADSLFNAYKSGITRLRQAGLKMPIMIDAPFCGINIDAVELAATNLINHDSEKNILFSLHLYDDDAVNSSYVENTILLDTYNKKVPFVIGEFSIAKDCDPAAPALDYQTMLRVCQEKQIGWLAWTWSNVGLSNSNNQDCAVDADNSTRTNMTKLSGNYKDLRGWGEIVAKTSPYSIQKTAIRPQF